MKITPVILCGGSGKRLWPLSRKHYPKQFLKIVGDKLLFQQIINRAINLEDKDNKINEIIVVTNESHRSLVYDQTNDIKFNLSN